MTNWKAVFSPAVLAVLAADIIMMSGPHVPGQAQQQRLYMLLCQSRYHGVGVQHALACATFGMSCGL